MGLWGEQVVPRIANRTLGTAQVARVRARVCADLSGEVLEIGFGSGLNVPHYPQAVVRVTAVEPSDVGWRLGEDRLARSGVPVTRSGLDGQVLPFPDASFDSALSTFTLCTIPDAGAALREVRRVLRPGAPFCFVEHGRAPEAAVQRWQRRIERVYSPMAGGCRLSRPIDELVAQAGFTVERLERYYVPGDPKPFSHLYEGSARA